MISNERRRIASATMMAFGACVAGQARAQPAPDPADPADIIVTAQKREERINDVPLAITYSTGQQLVRQGVVETAQLTKIAPSFTYQVSDYGTPIFTIRGIGFKDFSLGASPAVTTYVDQVPLPYSVMTRGAMLDLERVEILKGPQGTLFGQNSTGGAINYIAAKPTDTLHAGASIGYGRFNRLEAEGFVSGPISSTLSARLAIRHESQDGWQQSHTRQDRLGAARFNNARLLLDWKPTPALRFAVNLSGWRERSETQAMQFLAFTPSQPMRLPLNDAVFAALLDYPAAPRSNRAADWDAGRDFGRHDNFYLASVRGDWDISGNATLTSITAYARYTADTPIDADGTDFTNLFIRKSGLLKTFSQELRLEGSLASLRYTIGGNYQHETANERQSAINFASNVILGPFYFPTGTFLNNQKAGTLSAFGDLQYDVTDRVTLQASARYSDQKRDFAGCFADAGDGVAATAFSVVTGTILPPGSCLTLSAATFQSLPIVTSSLDQDNLSWRTSVKWKPATETLLYASITKGYKAGSYSVPAALLDSQLDPVTQESVLAYEAGVKLGLANGRVQVNAATFYYDYKNKQVNGNVISPLLGPLQQLINIPKSRVIGAELELVLRPVDGLTFTGGVTHLDSRVQADPVPPAQALDPLGNIVSYVGEAFPNTPKWLAVADAEYRFGLSPAHRAFIGGSFTYRSSSNASFGELALFRLPAYGLVDLRAGVELADAAVRIQAYARNITGKYYWIGVSRNIDTISRFSGMPATYGLLVSYRF